MLKKASLWKNSLINQEPRWERSSPCCTVFEYRVFMRCGFWPLMHSHEWPCSSQNFPNDKTAGVSSQTFIVKNISNSLTQTVASSCVCTSPLAVVTVVGLLDVVTVSNSAEFKSFLLIMCIGAPESTTKSLSSSLRFDGAGKHQLSQGEKNAALFFSFNFRKHLASFHAASRAHRSCHSVSSWDRSSNFGTLGSRWWGSPGQTMPSDGFLSQMSAWRTIAFVNFTHRIGFRMFELFRKTDDFGGSISWHTQSNCRVIFNITTAVLSSLFLDLCQAVHQPGDAHKKTFLHPHSPTCRTSTLEDAIFHKMNWCKFLWRNPCKQSKHSSTWDSFLWDFWFSMHFIFLPRRKARRRIGLCRLCTLIHIVPETAIVSFRTLPVGFPLPTISQSSLFTLFCPWFLTTAFLS